MPVDRRQFLWDTAALAAGIPAVQATTARAADKTPPQTNRKKTGALWQNQDELARGRPVTLIDQTGKPKWFRWRAGWLKSQAILGADNPFTIHSWTLSLLELVPDPLTDRYRLTAKVRLVEGDAFSEGGLYFAQNSYRTPSAELLFFTQVSTNAIRKYEHLQAGALAEPFIPPPPAGNMVRLFPHLHTDDSEPAYCDRRFPGLNGPGFKFPDRKSQPWHTLEVVVAPEKVTASWDGRSFELATSALQGSVDAELAKYPLRMPGPTSRGLRPTFDPRGGVGLYVCRGSASYRAVTVTPL